MNYAFSGIIVRYLRDRAAVAAPAVVEGEQKLEDQLHINLWDIADKAYLDIGLMVDKPDTVKAIWIDIPWNVERQQVIDLGPGLDGDKIITAIFNEVAAYEGASDKHYALVTLGSGPSQDSPFLLVHLDMQELEFTRVGIDNHNEVTRLRIKWPELTFSSEEHKKFRRYIRLRITHAHMEAFFSTFRPKDRNLLSSSTITRLLDFRVNVRRGVPDQVLLGGASLEFPSLKKIHVFAIVPRETELPFQGEGYKGCRSLEDEEIWNGYINLPHRTHDSHGESVKDYLGYQWTASSKAASLSTDKPIPAKDLVALGRFVHVTSSRWTSMRFVAVLLMLGTIGAAAWDECKSIFGHEGPSWQKILYWASLPIVLLLILLILDRATLRAWAGEAKKMLHSRAVAIAAWYRDL